MAFDWSNRNSGISKKREYHAVSLWLKSSTTCCRYWSLGSVRALRPHHSYSPQRHLQHLDCPAMLWLMSAARLSIRNWRGSWMKRKLWLSQCRRKQSAWWRATQPDPLLKYVALFCAQHDSRHWMWPHQIDIQLIALPALICLEQAYRAAMQTQWSWILQLCSCVEHHLRENALYFEVCLPNTFWFPADCTVTFCCRFASYPIISLCCSDQFFSDAKESMDYLKNLRDSIQRKYSCDQTSSLHRLEDLIQESMVSSHAFSPPSIDL